MAERLELRGAAELINLTFCCQRATVITDFSDLEAVGRAHYMNLHDGCASMEELEALDGVETALLLINSEAGTVTPYGVVYDNGMVLAQRYDGRHFPEYLYDDALLELRVTSKHPDPDHPVEGHICLPAPDSVIQRTLFRSELAPDDIQLHFESDALPQAVADALDIAWEDVYELNSMCCAIRELDSREMDKLSAAVLLAKPESASEVGEIARNLELFDFIPGVRDAEEYGKYMIRESGHFEYDSDLDNFYNYSQYGWDRINREQGQFNIRVKAVFYSLYFGGTAPLTSQFAGCFVTSEIRTRTVTETDEDGSEIEVEQIYTVYIPIENMETVYANIAASIGVEITEEQKSNADNVYSLIKYGYPTTAGGGSYAGADVPYIGVDGFCSPVGANWRNIVTSEFGNRIDPITGQRDGHTGMDLAAPTGTPIRAALDGTVTLSKYNGSYGYCVMIDHGSGLTTLYGHNSRLLVSVGQTVHAGDVISLSGATGRVTGPHLHFEVRVNGERTNPGTTCRDSRCCCSTECDERGSDSIRDVITASFFLKGQFLLMPFRA